MTNKIAAIRKGNKGEWSEFYAFIKILTDGKVFNAEQNIKIAYEKYKKRKWQPWGVCNFERECEVLAQ